MPRLPYLLLIFAAASWGIGTVVSKRAVAEFPPLTLLAIQLTASLAGLLIVIRGRHSSSPDPAERRRSTILTRLGLLPASTAAASFFLIPVFGMVGARLVLDERLSAPQLAGAALVVVAVATILLRSAARIWEGDELSATAAGTSRSSS